MASQRKRKVEGELEEREKVQLEEKAMESEEGPSHSEMTATLQMSQKGIGSGSHISSKRKTNKQTD